MAGISVALSGGGHRASLFGLGALVYLVDSGRNRDVTSIASVSGGSLTNGFIAQQLNFRSTTAEDFRREMKPFVSLLANRGTLFAIPLTKIYLIVLALAAGATIVVPICLDVSGWLKLAIVLTGILLTAGFAKLRGQVCVRAFAKLLFTPSTKPTKLSDVHKELDHVICATDLHAGEHAYFSGRFVCAYRFGWGTPGSLALHRAVQASAALPGAFPPAWFFTSEHDFKDAQDPEAVRAHHLVLADGGVYDNMGDQWGQGAAARNGRWAQHDPNLEIPDELIVVNSSAGLGFKSTASMKTPILGEISALLRDKSVLYDNGTSVRREALVARFDLAERENKGIKGALVHIPQSPLRIARAFQSSPAWPERARRAETVLKLLGNDEAEWEDIAKKNAVVKTTLSKLGVEVSARLLRHGYALAMANLHVVRGYPLIDVPSQAYFEELAKQ
ncbi:MAG: patatin-like phospholipase family protein [Actinomycetota bacterium]|nr:patatin-like phospholipase family protein [Actinomycetota bacterium]